MSACAHDADPSTGPVSKDDMVAIDLTETVHTEVVEPPKPANGVKKSNGAPHAVSLRVKKELLLGLLAARV